MKLPRDLSGADLIKLLCKHHGFSEIDGQSTGIPEARLKRVALTSKNGSVLTIDTTGISSKWGARPSRSPLATSRCEHLPHRAFGGTPTAARETHALPISPANWSNCILITP